MLTAGGLVTGPGRKFLVASVDFTYKTNKLDSNIDMLKSY
jgi:hypothetical protein